VLRRVFADFTHFEACYGPVTFSAEDYMHFIVRARSSSRPQLGGPQLPRVELATARSRDQHELEFGPTDK